MNTRPFLVKNEANFTLFKIPFEKYNEKLSLSNNFFKYEKTFSDNTKVKNVVLTEISTPSFALITGLNHDDLPNTVH